MSNVAQIENRKISWTDEMDAELKIEEATGGQVTPRDFVPSQAAPESAA